MNDETVLEQPAAPKSSEWVRRKGIAPTPEFPSDDQIRVYGELCFLYFRSAPHRNLSLKKVRFALQPPIDLGFYKIFRRDGIARSAVTWAFLNKEAEQKFVNGQTLAPGDWLSGNQMWVIEIISPYAQGTGAQAMNWLRRTVPHDVSRVRYMRTDENHSTKRIVEINRGPGTIRGARIIKDLTGD